MGWGGVGWLDKLKIKLSQLSTLVEVEVEAELGNYLDNNWTIFENILMILGNIL